MQEIALAVQEGASAYLNRQYSTIALAGVVIGIILGLTLNWYVAVGYFVGAIVGCYWIHRYARVCACKCKNYKHWTGGLKPALSVAFQSGAVTGILVVGWPLGVAGYYLFLRGVFNPGEEANLRNILGLWWRSFGASLISIFARLGEFSWGQTLERISLERSKREYLKMIPKCGRYCRQCRR